MRKGKDFVIGYPRFEAALSTLQRCFDTVGKTDEPFCRAFVGPSGSGKSTIARIFAESKPRVDRGTHMEIPVALVEVPPRPTVKSFAEVLLHALGDEFWYRGTTIAKSIRFRQICTRCDVRMLALDDFQHFVEFHKNIPYDVAEWLKEQIVTAKISVVVFGLQGCLGVFRQNEQLRRRFGAPFRLGPFRWDCKEEREYFRAFLHAVQSELDDFQMPSLDVSFCHRMNYASYGLIGYAIKIIRGAIHIARSSDTHDLTLRMFEQSYAEHVWHDPDDDDPSVPNPFADSFDPQKAPRRELPASTPATEPYKRQSRGRLKLVA